MWRRLEKGGWWLAGMLVALLMLLGWFQYRWLGALSEAERARMASSLASGVDAVGGEIDQLITELALAFVDAGVEGSEEPPAALARWRSTSPVPSLVASVWRLEPRRGQRPASFRLDEETGVFVETPLPPRFAAWMPRDRFRHRRGAPPGRARRIGAPRDTDSPAHETRQQARGVHDQGVHEDEVRGERPAQARAGDRLVHARRSLGLGHLGIRDQPLAIVLPRMPAEPPRLLSRLLAASILVIELDEATLLEQVLPALMARHLSPLTGAMPWARVVRGASREEVFHSAAPASARQPDAETAFLRLLPADRLASRSVLATGPASANPEAPRVRQRRLPYWDRLVAAERPRWRLEVGHPAGTLEAQVRVARRRNLGMASGVLAVLAASVVMLVASTRRAQALARQRLEMVAAVTHELRTPLAAVCSAGSNLADGVVTEPEGVRRYGQVIQDEGQRLARLVEQTLVYAGTLAGDALAGGNLVARPTLVAPWVNDVIGRRGGELSAAGMTVRIALDSALPPVDIDPEAMTRVLDNLVMNAIRHASEGASLDVAAVYRPGRRQPGGRLLAAHRPTRHLGRVELTVADRGIGLSARERRQIFEPFYRGRRARERAKGTGLGLAVVRAIAEAHGGSISVAPREAGGTVFTLDLPVAAVGEEQLVPATAVEPAPDSPAPDSPSTGSSRTDSSAIESPATRMPS